MRLPFPVRNAPAPPRRRGFRRRARPAFEALESRTCLSGGLLDPTFNGTGTQTVGNGVSQAFQTVVDSSGRAVAVANAHVSGQDEIAVLRLTADGSPDTTFGGTGVVYVKVGKAAQGSGLAIQPDGKIVVGGAAWTSVGNMTATGSEFVVARLNADGSLDKSFARSGVFAWDASPRGDTVGQVTVLPGGNIVATGITDSTKCSAIELSPSGALVTGFGSGGLAAVSVGSSGTSASAGAALAPNGDVIMVGTAAVPDNVGYVLALTPSGQPDTAFNGTGILKVAPPTAGLNSLGFNAVAVQGARLVVCGQEQYYDAATHSFQSQNAFAARFDLTGALDTTFGSGGSVVTTSATNFTAVAVKADGSLVLGGSQNYQAGDGSSHQEIAVAHLTADGASDPSFGTLGTGFVYVQVGQDSALHGLAIDASGRIVLAGSGQDSSGRTVAAFARLTA